VVLRDRPPTAHGFVFVTMEDKDGLVNVIVKPDVYQRYYKILRNGFLPMVEGRLQKEGAPSKPCRGRGADVALVLPWADPNSRALRVCLHQARHHLTIGRPPYGAAPVGRGLCLPRCRSVSGRALLASGTVPPRQRPLCALHTAPG
jgi:hypothetical protein